MEAKIIYADGTEMTVEKNGDCYILPAKPVFPANLSIVTVQSEEGNKAFTDAFLIECASIDGRYWFAFGEESPTEKTIRELRESNDMLTECILEMSEIIYGE
jgi:hypothetical protein